MKYQVTGYAMIPIEVSITVQAKSDTEAKLKALKLFDENPRKHTVPGSEDPYTVHDFQPNSAQILETKKSE